MQYDFLSSVGISDPVIVQGVVTEPGGATTAMFLYYVSDAMKWEGTACPQSLAMFVDCRRMPQQTSVFEFLPLCHDTLSAPGVLYCLLFSEHPIADKSGKLD